MFSVATARITPKIVDRFDSETLAAKFVLVEKECNVRFNKDNNTFTVTGEWSAVRYARSLLHDLVSGDESIQANVYSRLRNKADQKPDPKSKAKKKVSTNGKLYKFPGNPRKGRYKDPNPTIPEPGMFVQYHDTTFDRLEDLDLDTVLDNFERKNVDKKVTKEYLKNILSKKTSCLVKEDITESVDLNEPDGFYPVEKKSHFEQTLTAVPITACENLGEHNKTRDSVSAVNFNPEKSDSLHNDYFVPNLTIKHVNDQTTFENNDNISLVSQTVLTPTALNGNQNSRESVEQSTNNIIESFLENKPSTDSDNSELNQECLKASQSSLSTESTNTTLDPPKTFMNASSNDEKIDINNQDFSSQDELNIAKENVSVGFAQTQSHMVFQCTKKLEVPNCDKGTGSVVDSTFSENAVLGSADVKRSVAENDISKGGKVRLLIESAYPGSKKLSRSEETLHGDNNGNLKQSSSKMTKARKMAVGRKGTKPQSKKNSADTSKDSMNDSQQQKMASKQTKISTKKNTPEKLVYKCTECDYVGSRKKRLTEHMGRIHGLLTEFCRGKMEKTSFDCNLCDKTFVFGKDLSRHKKIVHQSTRFECNICNKSYKSKYVFHKHQATHVEGYVQPMFKCQLCDKEFTTRFSLSGHIKSAHLDMRKTYSCPTCGKTFSQIRSYRHHANVHAGIRPYKCEICGKSFTYDKSLKEHRYMHDTERRFSCATCGKTFRQKTCLLIHSKVHSNTRNHICGYCGKAFSQKQSLIRHERIHTGDRPYQCGLCQKTYTDYAVVRKHLLMGHKLDKDSWKQHVVQEDRGLAAHYIPGGPGYKPRQLGTHVSSQINTMTTSVQHSEITRECVTGNDASDSAITVNTVTEFVDQSSVNNFDGCVQQTSDDKIHIHAEQCMVNTRSQEKSDIPVVYGNIQSVSDTKIPENTAKSSVTSDIPLNINPLTSHTPNVSSSMVPLTNYTLLNTPSFPGYYVGSSTSEGLQSLQTLNYLSMGDDPYSSTYLKSSTKHVPQSCSNTNMSEVTIANSQTSQDHGGDLYSLTPVTQVMTMATTVGDSSQSYLSNTHWNLPTYTDAFYGNGIFNQYQQSPDQEEY